jgi:hypothetical protein
MKRFLAVMGLIVAFASTSFAATTSNAPTVTLTATVSTSISLVLSAATVDFPVVNLNTASNPASSTVNVTADWNLTNGSTLKFYAYFTTPNALTDGSGNNIPYSAFEIKGGDLGTTLTPVTQPSPLAAGNSSVLFKTVAISGANKKTTGDSTTLSFNLNMMGITNLPAGSGYNGTLNIQAQATP